MKFIYKSLKLLSCLSLVLLSAPAVTAQQNRETSAHTITGTVTDDQGEPLTGATVIVVGEESRSTITMADGSYTVRVSNPEGTLTFDFIGFLSTTVNIDGRTNIDVTMYTDATKLDDVVVIGYGTQRKNDLTGSISSLSSDEFNKGMVGSPEQLINGKMAGVQVVSGSGSPTAGSTIRIRGGASLNASNDPLIVLDGIPLETGGISGSGNFLSLINPNDIESMTVLKDASSTAIYGSRASNGVIIITTKKGSKNLSINASSTQSLQQRMRSVDVLSADQYREVIMRDGTAHQQSLLGDASTDWNKEIFRLAYGSDNNVSVAGSLTENFPFRVSAGYFTQDGILKTDRSQRASGNISLSPSFFQDHLKLNLNVKGSYNKNRFANTSAINAAAIYNPTIPVYADNDFGGYNEALNGEGVPKITSSIFNPLGLVEQRDDISHVGRIVGNFDIDYKMHFLPELRAHLTLGYDTGRGKGTVAVPGYAAQEYLNNGLYVAYGPHKTSNQLLTAYLNYVKDIESVKSRIDVTAGYDYQKWISKAPGGERLNSAGEHLNSYAASDQRHVLLSFYGRLHYTLNSKYMLTATVRRDGSSRFNADNRWNTFPSVALAWRISGENFLQSSRVLSNLKLRLSYGQTGQQDGIGNYGYLPIYTISQPGAQYQFGNQFYNTYRPEAYVSNLKWETTEAYNVGLDFGFLDERISGSVDYYTRKTRDLLATVPSPAGANFAKQITTNVGNMKSQGVEFTLNATPVKTKDWQWDVSFNATWQSVKITNLTLQKGAQSNITYVGQGFGKGGETQIQVMKEGYAPYTFYLYKQLYDPNGKPIEGAYADLNNDGVINADDLYCAASPAPDVLMGFSSNLSYKRWTLSFALRASFGNYAYNGNAMNMGAFEVTSWNDFQINNMSTSYLDTDFKTRQYYSDYYMENASFLKMDNISLGYDFGNIAKLCRMRVSFMVQNVFTITKYSGVDPEQFWGIESSFYPRARTFSINVGFDF